MDKIKGLVALLETPDTQIHCFDMGRRIILLPRQQFAAIEQTSTPYPYPLKNQARFALCRVDRKNCHQPMIWFLNLPLDEQGKLVLAARDYFIHRLLDAINQSIPDQGDPLAAAFKDNPHTFKPAEDRLASFNARVSVMLTLPPSRFYAHARDYFCSTSKWDQWQFIGYQGIADISARVDTAAIERCITDAIPVLPDEPLLALCHCLENQLIPTRLGRALLHKLQTLLAGDNASASMVAALLRSLSQPETIADRQQMLTLALQSSLRTNIEVLIAISGRGWEVLKTRHYALAFLQALADNPGGQRVFEDVVRDLLAIPDMRKPLLDAVCQSGSSPLLSDRMAMLKQNLHPTQTD